MKPKHHFHHSPIAFLGIPFLLLSPAAAHAQDHDQDGDAYARARVVADLTREAAEYARETTELANEADEKEKEKDKAKRAEEVAKRARETAERARDATERAKEATERAKEAAEIAETKKTEEEISNAKRAKEAAERAKVAAEQAKEVAERAREADEQAKKVAERAKEGKDQKQGNEKSAAPEKKPEPTPQTPADKPEPAESDADEKHDTPARGQDRRESTPDASERPERRPATESREGRERGERRPTPPAGTPTSPPADERIEPREEITPQDNDAVTERDESPELTPDDPAERESAEAPTTETERQAETEVAEVTREVLRELDQRKTRIEDREEAQALIDEILGAESRISRAEIAREERFRPRFERQGEEPVIEVSPEQRREVTTYFQERLHGREVEGPPPEFFRRSERRGGRDLRAGDHVVERVEFVRPRYLNEGRRYVHFDSRASIPAILMAAQAMNYVRFQPTREIAPIFYERQDIHAPHAMPLPPENYRSENSWVVSYPVDENSMISSEDILFRQGSTQFSDPYSYEIVGALADAMKAMPEEERFVIEGHASAEGSYDSNMVLSQQRAEYIVREIVRRGVSPYRLLPVGYGESEARYPANAAEHLRSQDRRVVVFRMKPELMAER